MNNNYDFKKLYPFKWFVLENFPFIEADFDAITNWQLFCKLGKEMNKIIDSVNLSGEQVENLTNAYNDLKTYVDNYFANLDVQEEINNKLDEMAEGGQLAEIISQYLNTNAILGFNNISTLKTATNLVNGSFARTFGRVNYNDGLGAFYKVREILNTDVIDDYNIVALQNPNLVAEKIPVNNIFYFANVNAMKQSTELINGKICKTLGYYIQNDGGGAYYYITNETQTSNNENIIELNNGNYAILVNEDVYINIKKFGAHEDGETDDSQILIDCLNYARNNDLIVQLNSKVYLINQSINIEIATDKIEGNNAKINCGVNKLFTFQNSNNSPYYNSFTIINNLQIEYVGTSENSICFDLQNAESEISHINFENLGIYGFDVGINIFSNAYLITFNHCDIFNCQTCVQMLDGGNNYGEKILFENCCIFNSTKAFYNKNEAGNFIVSNSSIDYNDIVSETTGMSQILIDSSHIEGSQKFIGNNIIENSVVIFNYMQDYIFSTYENSFIGFYNCSIKGQSQNKNLTNNSDGIIEFVNCKFDKYTPFINNETFINNNSLSYFSNYPTSFSGGSNQNTDYHNNENGVITQQNNETNFYKQYGAYSTSYFNFIVPRSKEKKHFVLSFEIETQQTGTVVLEITTGRNYSWNGKDFQFEGTKRAHFDVNLSEYSTKKSFVFAWTGNDLPLYENEICVLFDMNVATSGDLKISNVKLQEF